MLTFDIFLGSKTVGSVSVEVVGLYTQFQCQCNFPDDSLYRIIALYGTVRIDLGICIPDGNTYIANASVPTKYLNNKTPYFYALDGSQKDKVFVPVEPNERAGYLERLPEAIFHVRAEKKGLLIANH